MVASAECGGLLRVCAASAAPPSACQQLPGLPRCCHTRSVLYMPTQLATVCVEQEGLPGDVQLRSTFLCFSAGQLLPWREPSNQR